MHLYRKIPQPFPLTAIKSPFNEAFRRPPSHLKSEVSHCEIVTNKYLHWSNSFNSVLAVDEFTMRANKSSDR